VRPALGSVAGPQSDPRLADAPIVWARRNALMTDAHAGLVNGGRCLRKAPAQSPAHPDGCLAWHKLENVVIEGGGTLDANGSAWYEVWGSAKHKENNNNARPMMLDMMWVDGLTIRDVAVRRPGYWTIHPTVRAGMGRLSALSVSHGQSGFVWRFCLGAQGAQGVQGA
jgi:hypothetical protein